MKRFSLRYTLLTYRLDQLWLPAVFWALFAFVAVLRGGPDEALDTARAYLGAVIPLVGGILAAYAVLDDPALELRFATPTRAEQLLLERLGLTFAILTMCAVSFQWFALALEVSFSTLGNWADVQMTWLLPTLSLMGLGCAVALMSAQSVVGTFTVGLVWLFELFARNWLAGNAGKYVLVFMAALMPDHPALIANRVCLLGLSMGLLAVAWALLRRQERYI